MGAKEWERGVTLKKNKNTLLSFYIFSVTLPLWLLISDHYCGQKSGLSHFKFDLALYYKKIPF